LGPRPCKWAAKIEKKHWKKYFEELKSNKKNRRERRRDSVEIMLEEGESRGELCLDGDCG